MNGGCWQTLSHIQRLLFTRVDVAMLAVQSIPVEPAKPDALRLIFELIPKACRFNVEDGGVKK